MPAPRQTTRSSFDNDAIFVNDGVFFNGGTEANDFIGQVKNEEQCWMEAKALAQKLHRLEEKRKARMRRTMMKIGQRIHENNYRKSSTQTACVRVPAVVLAHRVGKVKRPRCSEPHLGFVFLLPCTGAVHECSQLYSQVGLDRNDWWPCERHASFLDLCIFLEGEYDGSPIGFAVLACVDQLHGYRDECRVTHLGGGRCAHFSTYLARFHARMRIRCDEGAHYAMPFFTSIIFCTMRSLTLAGIEAHIDLMALITQDDTTSGRMSVRLCVHCTQTELSIAFVCVDRKAYRHASAVSGSSRF